MSLSESDIAAIADAVAARLRQPTTEQVGIGIDDAQAMLGANSRRAAQWQLKQLGVRQYMRGRYRRKDVENAIARRTRA